LKGHGRDLVPLTDNGIAQAKAAARDPRIGRSEIILSSPYTRALHTAAIVSMELGIDIKVEHDLREW
jgi:broad specificity phosphatase PhoE